MKNKTIIEQDVSTQKRAVFSQLRYGDKVYEGGIEYEVECDYVESRLRLMSIERGNKGGDVRFIRGVMFYCLSVRLVFPFRYETSWIDLI